MDGNGTMKQVNITFGNNSNMINYTLGNNGSNVLASPPDSIARYGGHGNASSSWNDSLGIDEVYSGDEFNYYDNGYDDDDYSSYLDLFKDCDVLSTMNVTYYMWTWLAFVFIIIGTVGNCLTIAALLRVRDAMSSVRMLLVALAISDLAILYSRALNRWMTYAYFYRIMDENFMMCKLFPFLMYLSLPLSSWLVVLIGIERVINIQWPHKARILCRKRYAFIAILVIAMPPIGFSSIVTEDARLWELSSTETACVAIKFESVERDTAYLCMTFFVPFALLFVANVVIFYRLSQMKHLRVAGGAGHRRAKNLKRSSILVALVTLQFFLLLGPDHILLVSSTATDETTCEQGPQYISKSLTEVLRYGNAACNFFSYVLSGRHFRKDIELLICSMLNPCKRIALRNPAASDHAQPDVMQMETSKSSAKPTGTDITL